MTGRGMRRGNWSVQELDRLRQLLPLRGVAATAALLRRTPDSVRRRAATLFRRPARRTGWTDEDESALRRSWGAVEPRLLGVMLGRPVGEVLKQAAVLRSRRRLGPWTRDELRTLKRLYGTRSDEDLEICLQRGAADIAAQARRLCLQKDKRFRRSHGSAAPARMPRWSAAEIRRLRELYPDRENLEVARLLGRSVASVANKAWQLDLRKSPALLRRIGRTNVAARYETGTDGD